MSATADYVTFLTRKGVKLWVDNGQLRYHAKKGTLGGEDLARLRSLKGEIIAELTGERSAATDSPPSASVMSPIEAPLSFQQQWFLNLFETHPSWKATLGYTFHLTGILDPAALQRSLEDLLRMHASLRTRIVCVGGQWRQQIAVAGAFALHVTQVPGESESERRHNALLLIQSSGTQELDPTVSPLMRTQLLRISAQEHFLRLRIHRLATDCLGTGQALRDLWASYTRITQTGSSTSLDAPARYQDYALEQQATDAAWRSKHAGYWNEYLTGAQPVLWPARAGAGQSPSGAVSGVLSSLEGSFGMILSAGLRELGQKTQTLPALVTLTLFVACLSMLCGQKDLLLPFIIAGRAAAHEGIVGCFSHIVYLRIRLEDEEGFIELLKRVSKEFYRAAAFRRDSGRMVMERPELLRGALCQWLSWHPADIAASQTDGPARPLGLEVESLRYQNIEELTNAPPEKIDLEIQFFDAAGEISALATYRADRFMDGTPHRLMRELRSVAESAVRDPAAPIVR